MNKLGHKGTLLVIAILAVTVLAWKISGAQAQNIQPQFIVTWRAMDYAPPDFTGKILPTPNSPVAVSFELLNTATGKLLDLSRQTVYWYLNDNLISNKPGTQSLTFVVPNAPADSMDLRIELPSLQSNILSDDVQIPVTEPQAVIAAPYPEGRVGQNSFTLAALPYFFNVKQSSALNFTWGVNGTTPSSAENPNILNVNLGAGTPTGSNISVSLTIQNTKNQSEVASVNTNLIFTP